MASLISSNTFRPRLHSLDDYKLSGYRSKDENPLWKLRDKPIILPTPSIESPHLLCYYSEESNTFCNSLKRCTSCYTRISTFLYKICMMYKAKLIEKLRYLRILPGFLMIVSICMLFSNLISYEANINLLCVTGLVIFISAIITFVEFSSNKQSVLSSQICSFWWGVVLSLLTFTPEYYRWWIFDDSDRITDMMVATSVLVRCSCVLLDRCADNVFYHSCLITRSELSMLFGFFIIGVSFVDTQSDLDLLIVTMACFFVVANMRMKCTMAFPFLLLYSAVSGIAVYDNMEHRLNKTSLICYHIHLIFPSLSDFYFSPLSAIERWSCTFWLTWCKQILIIICSWMIEVVFCVFALYVITKHPEFELLVLVPLISIVYLLWVCAHLGFATSEVALASKLAECQGFYHKLPTTNGGTDIAHIMSNKGVRQLCMVGQQTVSCALLSTILFGALSWRRENAAYPALVLLVVGLECLSFGRHRELAIKLGGTCTAYAVIAPTTVANPKSVVTLLPGDSIKKQNDRATSLISSLHRFFAVYLIDNLGCDYSTNGIGIGVIDERIRNLFLKRHNNDGRYDTYFLYYSGLTLADGSFVLAGGSSLSPDQLLRIWQEINGSLCHNLTSSSRLLILLDVADPNPWLRAVSALRSDYVAVQACKLRKVEDAENEAGTFYHPGDFTSFWCHWNTSLSDEVWSPSSSLSPVYAVSRRWSDFALRSPYNNSKDDTSFAWMCRPCLTLSTSCSRRLNLVRLLGAPGRRYRRLKMRWFPPAVLATGHGFKLVRTG